MNDEGLVSFELFVLIDFCNECSITTMLSAAEGYLNTPTAFCEVRPRLVVLHNMTTITDQSHI